MISNHWQQKKTGMYTRQCARFNGKRLKRKLYLFGIFTLTLTYVYMTLLVWQFRMGKCCIYMSCTVIKVLWRQQYDAAMGYFYFLWAKCIWTSLGGSTASQNQTACIWDSTVKKKVSFWCLSIANQSMSLALNCACAPAGRPTTACSMQCPKAQPLPSLPRRCRFCRDHPAVRAAPHDRMLLYRAQTRRIVFLGARWKRIAVKGPQSSQ